MLPAALGSPSVALVVRCKRSHRGVDLVTSGAIAGTFSFDTVAGAELEMGDWFDANLGGGRLVEIRTGSRLVGVAEKAPMARAVFARALRLLADGTMGR